MAEYLESDFSEEDNEMRKCVAILLGLLVMAFSAVCFAADSFQMIYEAKNFTEGMKDNQALTETFTTPYGPLKFQMRKLWQTGNDKRMHLIAWLNDKRIAEQHYPKVEKGYTFRVIKDTSNSELYFVIESVERACLFGYSAGAQKLVTYIDSQNYAHANGAIPSIVALKDGDLILAFEKGGSAPVRSRYQFEWDDSTKWFSYTDIGGGWSPVSEEKQ